MQQSGLSGHTIGSSRAGGSGIRRIAAFVAALLLVLSAGVAQSGESPSQAHSRTAAGPDGGLFEVSVFFVTNRGRDQDASASVVYNGERGERSFGRCNVRFKPIPLMGELAAKMPFYLPSETNDSRVAEHPDEAVFWDQLTATVEQSSSRTAVVFVHGYNYGFERTCRMAAEMQRALAGQAAVLMFSWPSNGLPTDYVRDQADVEWSVPLLADLLSQLGERIGRQNVQVVAHSLGSRGVTFALQRMGAETELRPVIGRLVLLAPDFDSQTFVDLLPGLAPLTGGISLYASGNDTPLKLSRQLSGYPRLGEAGEFLTLAEGIETIDVSSAGLYQVFGHEYFFFNPLVEADLVTLLGSGSSAEQRSGLRPKERGGTRYWEVAPVR